LTLRNEASSSESPELLVVDSASQRSMHAMFIKSSKHCVWPAMWPWLKDFQ
jgi:hypothetical protein